jgi:dipeptidyl aminopeptidase/acylaminoacyl peptidase
MFGGFRSILIALLASPVLAAGPADIYGRLPSIEQAALSPDGSKIAFIRTTEDLRALTVFDFRASKLAGGVRLGDVKVRSVEWADDEHLLVTTATSQSPIEFSGTSKTEWNLMVLYDVKTGKLRALLDHVHGDATTMNVVYGRPIVQHKDGDTFLYVHGLYVPTGVTETALFRINLSTGDERLVKQGAGATNEWIVDDSGEIVAEQDYFESDRRWAIRLLDGRRVTQTVSGVAPIDAPDILGMSAAGDALIVALTGADGVVWKPLSIKTGEWGPELAANEGLSGLVRLGGSQRMIGTAFVGDTTRYHFEDPQLQDGWGWVTRVFGYERTELVSVSADHRRLIALVMGPKSGYGYHLADIGEHLTQPIGSVYEGSLPIAEVKPIKYPAADGLEIPAYLTLPPGRSAKDLPVIVFPHGGPQARDTLGFDWWAQALAARGYAVLQPNYRGSDLNQKWVESGYGEWGRKMQTDLSDGLAYLAAQGIVDPKRACIVGASYGGYAALAGVSIQSGIYRCAVSVAGVSDPANMLQWVAGKEAYGAKIGTRYWERFLGVANPGDKKLDAISPLKHADKITVPLMLIHGREDSTVPYEQSTDMVKALKRAGRTPEFVTLDKEDHYLSRSATRLQMLKSSLAFLEKNNPPD